MVNMVRGRGGGSLGGGVEEGGRGEESSSLFSFEVNHGRNPLSFSRPSERAEGNL